MHHLEATGSHAVPPAPPADTVLHYSETTGGHAETVGHGGGRLTNTENLSYVSRDIKTKWRIL
ncbi:MAG: hypothetical protein LBD24_02470 [Spirochaetaceae bacterium]|nr:hypothetical protein [Spirochaetaceae bacterium]